MEKDDGPRDPIPIRPNGVEETPPEPTEVDQVLETMGREIAQACGTLIDHAVAERSRYVVLIVPQDGGSLSFTTNYQPDEACQALRAAADLFEQQSGKTPLWKPGDPT